MKKVLSMALVLCVFASMLGFSASASVPTETKADWVKLLGEDFEGTQEFFTVKQGDSENVAVVPESEDSDNNVIDIKFGDRATMTANDGVTQYKYDNVRIGQGAAAKSVLSKGIDLPDKYIIELDVCGRNLIAPLGISVRGARNHYRSVNIDPNFLEKDKWYTYRILVNATETLDIDASTTTVMRKERDANTGFEVVPINKGYVIAQTWANNTIGIGVIASNNSGRCTPFIAGMDKTTEKMAPTGGQIFDGYTAMLDTHYQVDNINLYSLENMTKGEWTELIAEDFDGETQKYFTSKFGAHNGIEILPEAEDSNNDVIEIKFGDNFSEHNLLMYDSVRIGQGTVKTDKLTPDITLPDDYMVEFDMCAVNPVGHLAVGFRDEVSTSWYAIKINPNTLEKNVWYTYRIYTESTDEANSNTHIVMCKPRGSEEPFRVMPADVEYNRGASYVNSTINFGVIAQKGYAGPYIKGMDETLETRTAGTDTQTAYAAITESVYRLDNIKVYGKTADSYEMNGGIFKKYDMETADTLLTNATYLTTLKEDNGNTYIKYSLPETATDGTNYFTSLISATKDTANTPLPETFVISFDANNAELGFPLAFEVYGHGDGETDRALPRYGFYLKSFKDTKGIWYSYKVVATGKWNTDNALDFKVYRKERDKDEPYTLLTGAYAAGRGGTWPKAEDNDYGLAGTWSSKGVNRNQFRFGDFAYEWMTAYPENEAKNANIGGVWYIDNIEFADAASVSGNVNLAENVITAELNICAATACKPVVAIYDGDTFVGAGVADVTADGKVTVTVEGFAEGYTAKLFVWETENGNPMLGDVIDITELL